MEMKTLLTFLGCLSLCRAFPGGPPTSACASMVPNHGANSPQANTAPQSITVSSNVYRVGESITVTVASPSPFRGFFIQARMAGSTNAIGSFSIGTDTEIQLLTCPGGTNNAVAHNSRVDKTTKTFTWTSSAAYEVVFQATFVTNFTTFWTNVRSAAVQPNTTGMTTMSTPMQTTASDGSTMTYNITLGLLLVAVLRLYCKFAF